MIRYRSIPEPKAQKSSQEMGQAIYQRPEFNAAPVSTATADDELLQR